MAFAHGVSIQIGKGGVGKTSLACNFAGLSASRGMRVLLVDLDPQNNTARDLGYDPQDGTAFVHAILNGTTMPVLADVRDGLDVVPSGAKLEQIQAHAMTWFMNQEASFPERLEKSLEPIAEHYDLIVLDTPPGNPTLYGAALEISKFVVIPTAGDEASLDGVALVAERFVKVKSKNPALTLAGIVLFGTDARARRVNTELNERLQDMLEGVAPIFENRIRNAKSASVDARKHGLLAHELANASAQLQKDRIKALRQGTVSTDLLFSRNSSGLAEDYVKVTDEILEQIGMGEDKRNG